VKSKLVGKWIYQNGVMKKDDITQQIEWFINNHLKKITTDNTGWDVLFQDPDDERFWQLTYTQGELQGGGPPMLTCISRDEAKSKYLL
jgi:hypothetical protein